METFLPEPVDAKNVVVESKITSINAKSAENISRPSHGSRNTFVLIHLVVITVEGERVNVHIVSFHSVFPSFDAKYATESLKVY